MPLSPGTLPNKPRVYCKPGVGDNPAQPQLRGFSIVCIDKAAGTEFHGLRGSLKHAACLRETAGYVSTDFCPLTAGWEAAMNT